MELLVVLRTRNIGMIHPHFLNSNTYIQYMYCRKERMCRNAFESQSKRPLNNNTITGRFLLVKYCALLTSKAVGNWIRQTNYCGQHNTPFMFGLLFGLGVFDNAFINQDFDKLLVSQHYQLPILSKCNLGTQHYRSHFFLNLAHNRSLRATSAVLSAKVEKHCRFSTYI